MNRSGGTSILPWPRLRKNGFRRTSRFSWANRARRVFLVGVSRAITDFSYCTYLSDLAVAVDYQHWGIGRELVGRTHEGAGLQTSLVLLAAPTTRDYYGKIGMTRHDSAWVFPCK